MPIGLGTALAIGAGVVGAGATIYGASQASHAQTSAAKTAATAETSAANTAAAAQLQASQENNQLARDMYTANAARLDPYSTMGLAAGDEYMGLMLGNSPTAGGTNKSSGWAPVVGAQPTPSNALAPFAGATPTPATAAPASAPANAMSSVVQQQAQQAIADGADPAAVQARFAQIHGQLQ